MRVIAGAARSLKLETPEGMDTRPTTDRIKETLFNMIQFDIQGACFLDLFAGSGGIGIEALSRGAKEAVFVDNSKEACNCITANLKHTKLEQAARVCRQDVFVERIKKKIERLLKENRHIIRNWSRGFWNILSPHLWWMRILSLFLKRPSIQIWTF